MIKVIKNMKQLKWLFLLLSVVLSGHTAHASSQVSFMKPGFMMRVPSSSVEESPYLFRTGFASDLYGIEDFRMSQGVFFDMDIINSLNVGLSVILPYDVISMSTADVEYGFHLTKRVMAYGDISMAVGLWDFVLRNIDGEMQVDNQDFSIFAVISTEKMVGETGFNTYMGVGSGGLSRGFSNNDTTTSIGFFAGFLFKTGMMADRGGIHLIGEFDGGGLNLGMQIPLSTEYRLNLGISQLQWLPNFGKDNESDLPAISMGLTLAIPRAMPKQTTRRSGISAFTDGDGGRQAAETEYGVKLDSLLREADATIIGLRDSLRISVQTVDDLNNTIAQLRQQKSVLEDSLQSVKLQQHVMQQNINLALKHLSRSLRYFYAGDYIQALNEVDIAIQLNPNLSLAYARRGSIYYKMGDIQRATINWNLALQIDPGYDDVRNILNVLQETRSRTGSFMNDN
ncbi:TPA: hypothetical protein DCG86_05225 [Candidatus Marinimicrobia bacterium]|nr:hypothetical protein [Candidatus Neomarinimicrobiota bacterium]HBY18171.1 hypothetical protein [Candidatus Neomarinimicrobiota bacterium]